MTDERMIRWGILGTGGIAHAFARDLSLLPDAQLVAVGSRTAEAAARFAEDFGIPRRHASYEALAQDPDVDVIYISTPHPFHAENTLLCLEAGKAVLCEKPFALNQAQARQMVEAARERQLFLMEAMWTRMIPAVKQARSWLAEGRIGEVRHLSADLSFRAPYDPHSRLFDPALGGGALLDIGVYPIAFASMVLGEPSHIQSQADLGSTGVDEQSAYLFRYPGGQLALLSSSLQARSSGEALIVGTAGAIQVHGPFWMSKHLTLTMYPETGFSAGEVQNYHFPYEGGGYQFEAMEVMRCLREGHSESPLMPLDESLSIMRTLDTLRQQWGLRYPGE